MKLVAIVLSTFWLVWTDLPASRVDLTKIDRSIAKEPKYKTEPYYALIVIGPKAEKRVWLVVDGDVLYIDRNGNGDLTEANERVTLDAKRPKNVLERFLYPGTNAADVGEVAGLRLFLQPHQEHGWEWASLWRMDSKASLWSGSWKETLIIFCRRPEDAQICHFAGPLTCKRLRKSETLVRGSDENIFGVIMGTPGLPPRNRDLSVFEYLATDDAPAKVHPLAEFTFPHKDATQPPIRLRVVLDRAAEGSNSTAPCGSRRKRPRARPRSRSRFRIGRKATWFQQRSRCASRRHLLPSSVSPAQRPTDDEVFGIDVRKGIFLCWIP